MATVSFFEMTVDGGVGLLDGVLREQDLNAGRVEQIRQFSLWYEALLAGGGTLLSFMRFNPQITDPLVFAGIAFLTSRLGQAGFRAVAPMAASTASTMHEFSAPYSASQVVSLEEVPGILS